MFNAAAHTCAALACTTPSSDATPTPHQDDSSAALRPVEDRHSSGQVSWAERYQEALDDRMDSQFSAIINRVNRLLDRMDHHRDRKVSAHGKSRSKVITDRLREMIEWPRPANAGRWSKAMKELTQLADNIEWLAGRACSTESESIRFRVLEGRAAEALPELLDPARPERIRQLDIQPWAEIEAARCRGENPFLLLRPRFSCWGEAAVEPDLPMEDLPLTLQPISDQRWMGALIRARTGEASSPLPLSLQGEASTRAEDVDAVFQLLLQLPAKAQVQLGNARVGIVPLRAGSETAKRLFGDLPLHQQVRYFPAKRMLMVTTQPRGETCVVPSANPEGSPSIVPFTSLQRQAERGRRPAPFWLEIGHVLAPELAPGLSPERRRAAAKRAEEAEKAELVLGESCELYVDKCVAQCKFDHDALNDFLRALVQDAAADPFHMDLGHSEMEARAIACGLYLSGQYLTPSLQGFMGRQLGQHAARRHAHQRPYAGSGPYRASPLYQPRQAGLPPLTWQLPGQLRGQLPGQLPSETPGRPGES
ncbi:hypothetical protein SAMN05216359_10676 [Roseateles sp. YR242]|uniref:hypothetical protein n=1 Tax=Roseateles sp. YR242 TaxID=1855305 RepID=UPI0008B8736C|nr:hypothetical protein [Roseateles sp. YR242]SEL18888.1 hypothetical protein SAMN05216359_10676 [Roseateles sp. YR242]